jgi:hypothetical protein
MSARDAWDLYDLIWGIAFGAGAVSLAFAIAVMIVSTIRGKLYDRRMRRRLRDTGS